MVNFGIYVDIVLKISYNRTNVWCTEIILRKTNMIKDSLNIIKVGGAIVENEESLQSLLMSFSSLKGRKILVHGGGKIATEVAARLGVETQMIDGRRITSAEMLKVVTMVYAGLVNKTIVDKLRTAGCRPFGL